MSNPANDHEIFEALQHVRMARHRANQREIAHEERFMQRFIQILTSDTPTPGNTINIEDAIADLPAPESPQA